MSNFTYMFYIIMKCNNFILPYVHLRNIVIWFIWRKLLCCYAQFHYGNQAKAIFTSTVNIISLNQCQKFYMPSFTPVFGSSLYGCMKTLVTVTRHLLRVYHFAFKNNRWKLRHRKFNVQFKQFLRTKTKYRS